MMLKGNPFNKTSLVFTAIVTIPIVTVIYMFAAFFAIRRFYPEGNAFAFITCFFVTPYDFITKRTSSRKKKFLKYQISITSLSLVAKSV